MVSFSDITNWISSDNAETAVNAAELATGTAKAAGINGAGAADAAAHATDDLMRFAKGDIDGAKYVERTIGTGGSWFSYDALHSIFPGFIAYPISLLLSFVIADFAQPVEQLLGGLLDSFKGAFRGVLEQFFPHKPLTNEEIQERKMVIVQKLFVRVQEGTNQNAPLSADEIFALQDLTKTAHNPTLQPETVDALSELLHGPNSSDAKRWILSRDMHLDDQVIKFLNAKLGRPTSGPGAGGTGTNTPDVPVLSGQQIKDAITPFFQQLQDGNAKAALTPAVIAALGQWLHVSTDDEKKALPEILEKLNAKILDQKISNALDIDWHINKGTVQTFKTMIEKRAQGQVLPSNQAVGQAPKSAASSAPPVANATAPSVEPAKTLSGQEIKDAVIPLFQQLQNGDVKAKLSSDVVTALGQWLHVPTEDQKKALPEILTKLKAKISNQQVSAALDVNWHINEYTVKALQTMAEKQIGEKITFASDIGAGTHVSAGVMPTSGLDLGVRGGPQKLPAVVNQ